MLESDCLVMTLEWQRTARVQARQFELCAKGQFLLEDFEAMPGPVQWITAIAADAGICEVWRPVTGSG